LNIVILNLLLLGLNYMYSDLEFPGAHPTSTQAAAADRLVTRVEIFSGILPTGDEWSDRSALEDLIKMDLDGGSEVSAGDEVYLRADRVALPTRAGGMDPLEWVPGFLRRRFSSETNVVVPTPPEVIRRAGKFFRGAPAQWGKLILRGLRIGLVSLWPRGTIKSECGSFPVSKSDGDQRWIFDGRATNIQHGRTEHIPSTTPTCLSELECSESNPLYVTKADIRSYFFELRAPRWLVPWMGLPKVAAYTLLSMGASVAEIYEGLFKSGQAIPKNFMNEEFNPCMECWGMGYRHSPVVADYAHVGLVTAETDLELWQRLCDELLVPESDDIFCGICDDMIVFTRTPERGRELDAQLDAAYDKAGLERHNGKRLTAELTGETLGLLFHGHGRISPKGERIFLVMRASLEIVVRWTVSSHAMGKVVGHWSWHFLLWRPAFAIFREVYDFVLPQSRRASFIPRSAKEEMLLSIIFAPCLWCDLSRDWADIIGATDASEEGFGGVHASVPPSVTREVGRLSERRGEYVTLEQPDAGSESEEEWRALLPKVERLGRPNRLPLREWNFRVHLQGLWAKIEHINILELRAGCLHLRWLSRQLRHHHKRHVLLLDSKVALCVLAKGRSSSRRLSRLLRRCTALLAFADIKLYVVWIPTEENPADPPSRGRPLLPPPVGQSGSGPSPDIATFLGRWSICDGGFVEVMPFAGKLSQAFSSVGLATGTPVDWDRDVSGWDRGWWTLFRRTLEWVQPSHVHFLFEGKSFSRAASGDLRSSRFPWGLPELVGRGRKLVEADNTAISGMTQVIRALAAVGCTWSVECSKPLFWRLPGVRDLRALDYVANIIVDSCRMGGQWRKRRELVTSAEWMRGLAARCLCQPRCLPSVPSGKNPESGEFWSREELQYPEQLPDVWAAAAQAAVASIATSRIQMRLRRGPAFGRGFMVKPALLLLGLMSLSSPVAVETTGVVSFAGDFPLRGGDLKPATRARYTRALSNFHAWVRRERTLFPTISSATAIDDALEFYFNELFKRNAGRGRQAAVDTFSAVIRHYPRFRGELRAAHMALRSWGRISPNQSYRPFSIFQILLIEDFFYRRGWTTSAMVLMLAFFGVLRISEAVRLRFEDVTFVGEGASEQLVLRLTETKTGKDQPVRIRVNQDVHAFKESIRGQSRGLRHLVFITNYSLLRAQLRTALLAYNIACHAYVWHSCRHGGATWYYLEDHPLEWVAVMGRWRSLSTARRYIQQGAALLAEARLPQHLALRAQALFTSWSRRAAP